MAEDALDALAAEIHERLGLGEHDGDAAHDAGAELSAHSGGSVDERDGLVGSEAVEDVEAGVVSRRDEALAGVAQADDEPTRGVGGGRAGRAGAGTAPLQQTHREADDRADEPEEAHRRARTLAAV